MNEKKTMSRWYQKLNYLTSSLDNNVLANQALCSVQLLLSIVYLFIHRDVSICTLLTTRYLCQVFLNDIISHLSSVQLSIKSSTNHGHDVIYTSHPILVSQQVPNQDKEELLECLLCNLKKQNKHNPQTHSHCCHHHLVCTIW
jgi:hypothetical protein